MWNVECRRKVTAPALSLRGVPDSKGRRGNLGSEEGGKKLTHAEPQRTQRKARNINLESLIRMDLRI